MADPTPQTQTLPDYLQHVERWLDGLSNAEAGIIVLLLTFSVLFLIWLFRREPKQQVITSHVTNTANPTINPHIEVKPEIRVEIPVPPEAKPAENPHPNPSPASGEGLDNRIQIDRLPTVAGEFFGREEELRLLDDALDGVYPHPNPSPRGRGAKDGTDVPPRPIRERGLGGEGLQDHLTEAERLITETGYHRRDQELRDLQEQAGVSA